MVARRSHRVLTMTAHARIISAERDPRLWTADQFLEFYKSRPEGERWQLIDGLAIMMVPPSFKHQRIVANVEELIRRGLKKSRPDLFAFGNVGVRVPGVANFNPQPDVAVCDAALADQHYAESFLLAAEVSSPSNTAELIERKLELYRAHPDNLYCVTIDTDSVRVVIFERAAEKSWRRTELGSLGDMFSLPAFGVKARVQSIYKGTPLAD